jgi:hypothetical protein
MVLSTAVALPVLCAIALGQTAPATPAADASPPPRAPSSSCDCAPCLDQFCYSPRWTASADVLILDRVGSFNQTLVETVSRIVPYKDLPYFTGVEQLNANDLQQGFAAGPRLNLTRRGQNGYDLELSYFQLDGWHAHRGVGPTPDHWLVMRAPGGFLQTQDHKDTQLMVWDYASQLYNAELNVRWHPCDRITVLAGFRWANLSEDLLGTLPPNRREFFWDTKTTNNLYGFQIGADGRLFDRGRFCIDVLGKAGLFDNIIDESADVSIDRFMHRESALTNRAAFLGQLGVQCRYQFTPRLLGRIGYEALWLQGVALAPGQIQQTYSYITNDHRTTYVEASGINSLSGVFYHGATAGLEYAF